jgi:hypothetical protein
MFLDNCSLFTVLFQYPSFVLQFLFQSIIRLLSKQCPVIISAVRGCFEGRVRLLSKHAHLSKQWRATTEVVSGCFQRSVGFTKQCNAAITAVPGTIKAVSGVYQSSVR